MSYILFLPGTGRWHREAMTEGDRLWQPRSRHEAAPLHHAFGAVPLPVPGRNG